MRHTIVRILGLALPLGMVAVPALGQSANYGLDGLKSYDTPIAPPANGLARVVRSEQQPSAAMPSKFKLDTPPVTVAIHGYGEVIVDSTSRR